VAGKSTKHPVITAVGQKMPVDSAFLWQFKALQPGNWSTENPGRERGRGRIGGRWQGRCADSWEGRQPMANDAPITCTLVK